MNQTFQPIYNEEAEQGVCIQLLAHPELAGDVNINVTPDDFWKREWKATYTTILNTLMEDLPLDVIKVADDTARALQYPEDQAKSYRAKLLEATQLIPVHGDPTFYAQIVREKAIQRKILDVNRRIEKAISEGRSLNGETEEIQELSKSLTTHSKHWKKTLRTTPVSAASLKDLVDKPIPYLIFPLVVEGSLTQVQGIPKGGKSAFCLYLAACAAQNIWPNPEYISGSRSLNVLYISWEDPDLMMAKRLSLYQLGMGKDRLDMPENLIFLFAPTLFLDREDHAEALKEAIAEYKADIVIFDTLSHAHQSDNENDATQLRIPMAKMYQVAQATRAGIIYIHHTAKGSSDRAMQEKARGSTAIAAAWHICLDWGVREKGSDVNPIQIQSKYEHESLEWAISYLKERDDNGKVEAVKWLIQAVEQDKQEDESSVEKRRRMVKETVQRINVSKVWTTSKEVTEQANLGVTERAIRRILSKFCQDGEMKSVLKGGVLYFSLIGDAEMPGNLP